MRYFAHIQYNGAGFSGWQKQPNELTIQGELESTLSTVLRVQTSIVGCGRTDAGVHASQYYFHFDTVEDLHPDFAKKITGILPEGIAIRSFLPVEAEAHARYDATARSYIYHISRHRDPFRLSTNFHFPFYDHLDHELMKTSVEYLLGYDEFLPFCKTNSDVNNYKCQLTRCEWVFSEDGNDIQLHLTANRFLRGMVRLIVGMSLNVGLGKITMADLEDAMKDQTRLKKALSVPPNGLFLCGVQYPYIQ